MSGFILELKLKHREIITHCKKKSKLVIADTRCSNMEIVKISAYLEGFGRSNFDVWNSISTSKTTKYQILKKKKKSLSKASIQSLGDTLAVLAARFDKWMESLWCYGNIQWWILRAILAGTNNRYLNETTREVFDVILQVCIELNHMLWTILHTLYFCWSTHVDTTQRNTVWNMYLIRPFYNRCFWVFYFIFF